MNDAGCRRGGTRKKESASPMPEPTASTHGQAASRSLQWHGPDGDHRAHRSTQKPWAIKVIDLDAAQDEVEDIQGEIAILARCSCPNIVAYGGAFLKGPKLWIVMELMVGSAQDLVRPPRRPPRTVRTLTCAGHPRPALSPGGGRQMRPKNTGPYDEATIAVFARDTLVGLQYLHRDMKIHRDIKGAWRVLPPAPPILSNSATLRATRPTCKRDAALAAGNILVSKDCVVKLADFGITTQLTYDRTAATSYAGTPQFMAPEVVERRPYNSKVVQNSAELPGPALADSPKAKGSSRPRNHPAAGRHLVVRRHADRAGHGRAPEPRHGCWQCHAAHRAWSPVPVARYAIPSVRPAPIDVRRRWHA